MANAEQLGIGRLLHPELKILNYLCRGGLTQCVCYQVLVSKPSLYTFQASCSVAIKQIRKDSLSSIKEKMAVVNKWKVCDACF